MAFDNFYIYGFKDYVSVAERRRQAASELAKLNKHGRQTSPIVIDGRKIALTFWGKAWCDNLERYSDYANRLPRGRSYVRNGSVVDLQIAPGSVTALVSGSDLYNVTVTVSPVVRPRWNALRKDCSGAIESVIELLQGQFSDAVMTRLCDEKTGMFPSPKDIAFECSCPDWASLCKHVAAVLYGIGARLDRQPELLFTLRQVKHEELITDVGARLSKGQKRPASAKVLAEDDLSGMFGIEIAAPERNLTKKRAAKAAVSKPVPPPPVVKPAPILAARSAAAKIRAVTPRSKAALRRAIAARLKQRAAEIQRARKRKP